MTKEFALSAKNWQDILINEYTPDFTFILNGKRYQTPRFVADVISPRVRKLHFIDESIKEFIIDTDHPEDDDNFSEFLSLFNLKTQTVTSSRLKQYASYFIKLGNVSEYMRIYQTNVPSLTIENAVSLLQEVEELLSVSDIENASEVIEFQPLISFVCEHFEEISIDERKKLSKESLLAIISSDSLRVSSEDEVLDFVVDVYREDRSYSTLFSAVFFENVSQNSIDNFIQNFCVDDIDSDVWRSICLRLRASNSSSCSGGRYKSKFVEFKAAKGQEFNGIMRYLTDQTGGNISKNGTISITSNSIRNDPMYLPENIVDYENENYFLSNNDKGTFICFDFKDNRVQLSDYSIKTYSYGANCTGHLRSWVIEVSNDGQDWKEVDQHSNDSTLNGPNIVATFKVSKESSEFYRFIRLRSTGCDWHSSNSCYYIYCCFIEFFGKLKEQNK